MSLRSIRPQGLSTDFLFFLYNHSMISDSVAKAVTGVFAAMTGRALSEKGFIVVVSPAVRVLYRDEYRKLTGLCRAAGAISVLPVDAGIPAFAHECAASIRERGSGIHILSACPAASDFLTAEFPALAPSVLGVPSPMAMSSREALEEAGIPDGTAIAISPCSIKKREESTVDFDMRVVQVHSFVAQLGAAGLEFGDFPESDYDRPFPLRSGDDCGIACAVAGELSGHGQPDISAFTAEGQSSARKVMTKILADRRPERKESAVVELTFCEGGCLRDPFA